VVEPVELEFAIDALFQVPTTPSTASSCGDAPDAANARPDFIAALDHADRLIGAEIGEGASDQGCRAGPRALQQFGLAERLGTQWAEIVSSDSALRAHGVLALAHEFSLRLAASVRQALLRSSLPLVVGGDHSCAVGTWSAAAEVLRPRGRLGLWVDAHLDSPTPETSDTKALHGMLSRADGPWSPSSRPSALLQRSIRDVVIIGTRSYEDEKQRWSSVWACA
jgi:arginase